MFSKSIFTSLLVVTAILVLLLSSSYNNNNNNIFVEAKWTVLLPGGRSSILESLLGGTSTSSVKVVARNSVAKFQTKMQNDASVFPGSCKSDQPNLPYGWEAYKKEMIRSLSVSVSLDTITILLWPRIGYSITSDETITCGPFKSQFDEPYWLGDSLNVEDQTFSFSITRAPRTSVGLYKIIDTWTPIYTPTPLPSAPLRDQIDEGMIRDYGFQVFIVLNNDNWDAKKLKEIGAGLSCTPVNCFSGLVSPDMFTYDTNVPNVVNLTLNRTHMRTFDVDQKVTIKFSLPNNGQNFGLKGAVNIEMPPQSNSFHIITSPPEDGMPAGKPTLSLMGATLAIDAGTGEPIRKIRDTSKTPPESLMGDLSPLPLNTMYIEERCLRGKLPVSSCNRTLFFTLPPSFPDQTQRFFPSSLHAQEDIRLYTLWSTEAIAPMNEIPWYEFEGFEDTATEGTGTGGLFRIARLPEYEIWKQDIITITPPFSVFVQKEPPAFSGGNPARLVVTPSPGDFFGGLRDIEQREIWRTELIQYLILDGESWTEAARLNLLHNVAGDIAPGFLGFNTQKVQLLDYPGAVEYARTSTGRLNYTTLVIKFKKMPEFEMEKNEENIYFGINVTWIRSGLPLTIVGSKSFKMTKSPGELTVVYNPIIEESLMLAGGYNLSMTLAGDKWTTAVKLPDCLANLCLAWNSTNNGTLRDPVGWINRRTTICQAANMSLRANRRTLDMVFVGDPLYNTKRGETIKIAIPAVCSVTGNVAPVGYYDLKVLPKNGNVTFEISYDGGLTRENLTEVSEGALREAKVIIYLMTHGDNWDELNPGPVSASVFNESQANSYGTFGWNNKKHEMIAEPITDLMKFVPPFPASEIRWTFKPVSTFDLAANETVTLDLRGFFMASGRQPIIPSINFTIYASPGIVELVEWAGTHTPVTEADVRWGRVWFQFRIVGEQWRRDNQPFIKSFSGNDTKATALNALVGSLIPAIEFFNFTVTPDGYEYLRLTLQSNDKYDIDVPENMTISLQPQTVVSGIQPLFEYPTTETTCVFSNASNATDGVLCTTSTYIKRSTEMSFIIQPAPARVIISGGINLLNEKKMRQSKLTHVYLTLIGDTWNENNTWPEVDPGTALALGAAETATTFDAAYYLRRNISATPEDPARVNLKGYSLINDTLLPFARIEKVDSHIMLLKFVPDRRYKLNTTEIITIDVDANATTSRIAPTFVRNLTLYVDATGGELRLADETLVVTEKMLRDAPLKLSLVIDGDALKWPEINKNPGGFLDTALKSQSSILAEPDGFTKNREVMLRMTDGQQPLMVQGTQLDLGVLITVVDIDNTSNSTNATTTTEAPMTTTTQAPNNTDDVIKNIPVEASFSFGLKSNEAFNIRNDEELTLTMRDPKFFDTGITADPDSVTILIKKVPQVMVMFLDQSRSFSRTYQTDPLALKTRIAGLLALPVDRVITEENKPPFTPDGLLIMRVWFDDDETIGTAGYLTNSYLTDTFMSLNRPYLDTSIAIKQIYFEDNPPSSFSNGAETTTIAVTELASPSFVWGIVGGTLIILGAILFVVGLILQKARLSLSSLKKAGQRTVFKSEGKYEDKELDEKEADILAQVNKHTIKQTESPFFVGSKAKEAQMEAESARRNARLRRADEEGIQLTASPMSLREYARKQMGSKSGGASMGLDALGLSPKDIREGGVTLDEELAGERDDKTVMEEKEQFRKEQQMKAKYFTVASAEKREKLDSHGKLHSRDHRKVIDLMADL